MAPVGHPQESAFWLIWGRDFVSAKDSGRPEYFMYCGLSEMHSRGEKSTQSAKGVLFCGDQLHRRGAPISKESKRKEDSKVLSPKTGMKTRSIKMLVACTR